MIVSRIKTETGTSIIIPPDSEKSDFIRIEGDPMGVKAAKTMLLEMAAKMVKENLVKDGITTLGVTISVYYVYSCKVNNTLLFGYSGTIMELAIVKVSAW